LNSNDSFHGYFGAGNADCVWWKVNRFQIAKLAFTDDILVTTRMARNPTPLAAVACQALGRPASFLADCTLGVAWQVTFPPVVLVMDQGQLLAWDVRGILLTVSNGKILAFPVNKVLTNFTMNGQTVLKSFPTDIAKLAFVLSLF